MALCARRGCAAWLAALACWSAAAQEVSLEPSGVIRCLTPAEPVRGAPEYPFAAWKNSDKGRVLVVDSEGGTLQLDVPRRTQDSIFADSTTIAVPCLKIDLKPQE